MKVLDFVYYGYKYHRLWGKKRNKQFILTKSVLFVAAKGTEKWILGAKARRLERYSEKGVGVSFVGKKEILPEADGYFYLHQKVFSNALRGQPLLLKKRNVVMFTHPVLKHNFTGKHLAYFLNKADKVIFLNKANAEMLISFGLKPEKAEVMHLASDAEKFKSHHRSEEGAIVVSMAFYERKNPYLLLEIIQKMPHRKFIILGPNWSKFEHFEILMKLDNLEYLDDIPYDNYPKIYEKSTVFLSTSKLEGGPVPLLETMLCNLVPVASKTGFCVDIIKHGENGFLFELDAKAEEVVPMIEEAYTLTTNTRQSVMDYTWQKSAAKIDHLFA